MKPFIDRNFQNESIPDNPIGFIICLLFVICIDELGNPIGFTICELHAV